MKIEETIEYKEQNPYTDPELRERIKNKLLGGNKGGRPGQWSARKSQLLAVEYKAQGGKYHGPKTNKAKSLDQWSKEKWQTSNGKPALRLDGKMSRYLPKAEWDKLTEAQKQATNQKKLEGDSQYVSNTAASKQSK
jgi:hypothetical protein